MQNIIDKFTSTNLSLDQALFFAFGISIIFVLVIAAKVLSFRFKNLNFGFIVIALWSLLISIAFFFEYFKFDLIYFLAALAVLSLSFILYTLKFIKISFKDIFDKKLLEYLIAYLAVLGVILFTFIFVSQQGTILPAPWLSNDSIMHSILAKGRELTAIMGLNPYFDQEYTRGSHAFIYYLSKIFGKETYYLLFPITAVAYAALSFTALDIIDDHKGIKGTRKFLLLILVAVPFSNMLALYGMFMPQMFVIPLLLTCLYNIFKFSFLKIKFIELLFLVLIFIGIINIYGVYAFTVIAGAIFLKVLLYLKENSKDLLANMRSIEIRAKTSYLISGLLLGILAIPSILQFVSNAIATFNTRELVLAVNPNFYSAFQLTGVWFAETYFKDPSTNLHSYILLSIFALQVFFLFKNKINSSLRLSLIVLTVFLAVFVIILEVPYASFKYLTFLIPFFILSVGISYFSSTEKYKWLSIAGMIVFIFFTYNSYYEIFTNTDTTTKKYLETIESINEDYLAKGSTIVFSGETRLNYFKEESDDIFETAWYFPKYEDQNIDFVIVQWRILGADPETNRIYSEFMTSHSNIKEEIANLKENCIEQRDEFTIYNLKCTNESL